MALAPILIIPLAALVPVPVGTDSRRSIAAPDPEGRAPLVKRDTAAGGKIGQAAVRAPIPWVTLALILANVLAYAAMPRNSGADPLTAAIDHYGLVPRHPTPGTFLTTLFIQVSPVHLLWNMAFLWFFGSQVESALGAGGFSALYLGSGISASLCHLAICMLLSGSHPEIMSQPLVGASGAISGLIAPSAIRFYRSRLRFAWLPGWILGPRFRAFAIPAIALVVVWLAQNVAGAVYGVFRVGSGVAYWAHLGGFAFGLIVAEVSGLLRDGRADYFLTDARAASGGSGGTSTGAIQYYREYLALRPAHWQVGLEMALVLKATGRPEARSEADAMVVQMVRDRLTSGRDVLAVYAEARRLDLKVALTPREKLRLASQAQDAGRADLSLSLLHEIVTEDPSSPEDETARFKLGQLLLRSDPAQAHKVLSGFLERYGQSPWLDRARDLLAESQLLLRNRHRE